MVGSELTTSFHKKKELVDDGYFILNGNEKVLVPQEKQLNRAIVHMNNRCMFRGNQPTKMWWLEKREDKSIDLVSKHGACSIAYIFAFFDYSLSLIHPLAVRIETECIMRDVSPKNCVEEFQKVFPRSETVNFVTMFGSAGRLWLTQLSYMCYSFFKWSLSKGSKDLANE